MYRILTYPCPEIF